MPLDRPPRPLAGAVTDSVRGAILRCADEQLGLNAPTVLSLHTEAEYLADAHHLLADVDKRYTLDGALHARVRDRLSMGLAGTMIPAPDVSSDEAAGFILLELPDTEFLTAMEHAVVLGFKKGLFGEREFGVNATGPQMAGRFFRYADEALRSHGAPYHRAGDAFCFEWAGDPKQHVLTIEPALLALADARLQGGPRDDFERALGKRRLGAAKDLEDAMVAAARSVESVLKVLHDAHDVEKPSRQELAALFNRLAHKDVGVLPGFMENLVLAVGGPRNHMAGHGPGADVRLVPDELADASIAAAATAITFLAHYLP